jgi:ribonuclease T2
MRLRLIAAVLIGLLAAPLAALAQSAPPAASGGNFDFYILSLSWSPGFCGTGGADRARQQCAVGAKLGFVVHGLWPQYDRGRSPQNCGSSGAFPTRAQIDSVHDLYPEDGLARHEWRAHGTCSGLSPADYFAAVRQARKAVTIPAAFVAPKTSQSMATGAVARAFLSANNGLPSNGLAVTCRSEALEEVRICISKDLRHFQSCPDVSRRGCRVRQISIPPVN